jgi:hypothetical protein
MGAKIRKLRSLTRAIILLTLLLLLLSILNTSSSQNTTDDISAPPDNQTRQDENDATEAMEWIETTLEFTFEDPVRLTIQAEFEIHEIFLSEYASQGQMTADGIRKQYSLELPITPVNPPIQLSINQKVNELFVRLLNQSFPNTMYILESPSLDIASLQYPVDSNLYDPPVMVTQFCSYLELTENSYFSSKELAEYNIQSLEDLIEGTLKMGGSVTQDLRMYANAGHKNTYIFKVKELVPPTRALGTPHSRQGGPSLAHDQLLIEQANSEVQPESKDKVRFTLDRTSGMTYVTKKIRDIKLRAKEPNTPTEERIDINYNLDMDDFDKIMINDSKVVIRTIRLDHIKATLPSNFSDLELLTADGLRLFYENGIIDLAELEDELDTELNKIENRFDDAFETDIPLELGVTWDFNSVFNITPLYYLDDSGGIKRMSHQRPVNGYIRAAKIMDIEIIKNASTELIKGLLNAGAKADLDLSIKSKYDYKYNLTLPPGFELVGHVPRMVDSTTGANTYLLSMLQTKDVIIKSQHAPAYTTSKADIDVTIDLHEVEILSFTEYMGHIKIDAAGSMNRLEMEPSSRFARAMPEKMAMKYFNSDSLRLLYTEGLLNLSEIEDETYVAIQENISKLLKEDLQMRVDFGRKRLEFDGDYDIMDDSEPIKFKIAASGKMRVSGDRMVEMGSFITKQIKLPITGVENWNVTYTFILPKYIEVIGTTWVEDTDTDYNGPFVEQTLDDRYQLTITVHGESELVSIGAGDEEEFTDLEVEVNMDIDITLWFFLDKIMVPIVLFIILLVLIITLKLLRRRSTKKLERMKEEMGIEFDDDDVLTYKENYGASRAGSWKARDRGGFRDRFRGLDFGRARSRRYNSGPMDEDYGKRIRELMPKHTQRGKVRSKAGDSGGAGVGAGVDVDDEERPRERKEPREPRETKKPPRPPKRSRTKARRKRNTRNR